MIHGHGGNIYEVAGVLNCRPSEILDMRSNINPLGPPPGLLEYLMANMDAITRLPEVDAGSTVERFILIKLLGGLSANEVWQRLAREKILIRLCANIQGLSDRFIRISLKMPGDNRLLASSLLAVGCGSETQADGLNKLRVAC